MTKTSIHANGRILAQHHGEGVRGDTFATDGRSYNGISLTARLFLWQMYRLPIEQGRSWLDAEKRM